MRPWPAAGAEPRRHARRHRLHRAGRPASLRRPRADRRQRRTRTETIERELQFKAGDPLGLDAINEASAGWRRSGCSAARASLSWDTAARPSRDLLVTVEEAPATTIGYGGGLEGGPRIAGRSRRRGGPSRLEVAPRAFFEIGRRNLFGKNRSVNLSPGSASAAGLSRSADSAGDTGYGFSEYRVVGTFREPRVFGTAADAFLTGIVEQQTRSSFNFARRASTPICCGA